MSARLDLVLQKWPEHEEGIRLLASRDPSGNLKYLDWGAKVLVSKQALAPEIADVIELFHQFSGRRGDNLVSARRRQHLWIRPDIYSYRPQDLASLRDSLIKMKRASERKRREREKLYKLAGPIEAEVVYESADLIVRHIKNKAASCHYGLGTKWCIAMLREGYFEDYETQNATFFFIERKTPKGDEYDKVAVMVPRSGHDRDRAMAFTALDKSFDMMKLAKVHGTRVFDIYREIYERSEKYPGSAMMQVSNGNASQEALDAVFAMVVNGLNPSETESILESIVCNDAASWPLLEEVVRRTDDLVRSAWKLNAPGRKKRRRSATRESKRSADRHRKMTAALVIHPNTPEGIRQSFIKDLRRRHVKIHEIQRVSDRGARIGISYRDNRLRRLPRRGWYRRTLSLSQTRRKAKMYEGRAARLWKSAERLERKKQEAKEKADAKAQKIAKKKRGRK